MCLAVPGKIVAIEGDGEFRNAKVDFGGVQREACLVFVPEAEVGDYVLIHVGFALARVDEAAAQQVFDDLEYAAARGDGDGNASR